MKLIATKKTSLMITLLAMVCLSWIFVDVLYSGVFERGWQDGSKMYNAGYINDTNQRTQSIISQLSGKTQTGFWDGVMQYLGLKAGAATRVDASLITDPELKKKKGGGTSDGNAGLESATVTLVSPEGSVIVEPDYDFTFGSGIVWDTIGNRIVSEYIEGVKHIYVGFETYGFEYDGTTKPISDAISMSLPGDIVMVRGCLNEEERYYFGDLSFSTNARIYGGYDEFGNRDILNNVTAIIGNVTVTNEYETGSPAEVNGFWFADGAMTTSRPFYSLYNVYATYMTGDYYDITTSSDFWLNAEDSYGSLGDLTINGGTFYWGGRPNNLTVSNIGRTPEMMFFTTGPSAEDIMIYERFREARSYYDRMYQYESSAALPMTTTSANDVTDTGTSSKEKEIAKNSERIATKKGEEIDETLAEKALRDKLTEYALTSPLGLVKNISIEEGNIPLLLENLLKNLSEEQKKILDSVADLLSDTKKLEELTGSEDIKKATDELIQKVAAFLLAQALPDLLKESDMANVKDIFSELSRTKAMIITDYQQATKPYYEEMKKILAKNLALLQLKNIISKEMTMAELQNLPRSDIDAILDKVRKAADKAFEEHYILQQEEKYRKEYIDPNKKILEERIKGMLKDFSQRLSSVLEGVEVADKKDKDIKLKK